MFRGDGALECGDESPHSRGPRTLIPSQTALLPGKIYYDLAAGIDGAQRDLARLGLRARVEPLDR